MHLWCKMQKTISTIYFWKIWSALLYSAMKVWMRQSNWNSTDLLDINVVREIICSINCPAGLKTVIHKVIRFDT